MTLKKKKIEIARLRLLLLAITLKCIFAKSKKDRAKAYLDYDALELQIQMVIAQPLPKDDTTFTIVAEKMPEVIVTINDKKYTIPKYTNIFIDSPYDFSEKRPPKKK